MDRLEKILGGFDPGQPHVAFNFSDMRTGKSIEFIELCRRKRMSLGSVLIVAPLSTLWSVQAEFKRWLGWEVHINPKTWLEEFDYDSTIPNVVAVNKERLRDKKWWGFEHNWSLLLLDEGHHFRGRKSLQTKGAFRVAKKARKVVVATGTPIMNGLPKEIWPFLHMLDPKGFSSFWRFMGDNAANLPSVAGPYQDERAPWKAGRREIIKTYLAKYAVRRTYDEVRGDLPPVTEQTLPIDLSVIDPAHWKAYQELEATWRTAIAGKSILVPTELALTAKLKQFVASPNAVMDVGMPGGKIKAIADYLTDYDGKAIIFCWHKRVAKELYEHVARRTSCDFIAVVDGDLDPADRADMCSKFQTADSACLIATIASLSEGVSLDTADTLIFAEKSWVPAQNDQAAARILGENQKGSPLVLSVVAQNTIEEKLEKVLMQKGKINDDFVAMRELIYEATR